MGFPLFISSSNYETNANNNKYEGLGLIALKPVNILMTTGGITKTAPLPQSSTNMQAKKFYMSGLDTSQRDFSSTPEDKFKYQ